MNILTCYIINSRLVKHQPNIPSNNNNMEIEVKSQNHQTDFPSFMTDNTDTPLITESRYCLDYIFFALLQPANNSIKQKGHYMYIPVLLFLNVYFIQYYSDCINSYGKDIICIEVINQQCNICRQVIQCTLTLI